MGIDLDGLIGEAEDFEAVLEYFIDCNPHLNMDEIRKDFQDLVLKLRAMKKK